MTFVKGTDSHGKEHWLQETRTGSGYVWTYRGRASDMPLFVAERWVADLTRKYSGYMLDPEDRMTITLVRGNDRG